MVAPLLDNLVTDVVAEPRTITRPKPWELRLFVATLVTLVSALLLLGHGTRSRPTGSERESLQVQSTHGALLAEPEPPSAIAPNSSDIAPESPPEPQQHGPAETPHEPDPHDFPEESTVAPQHSDDLQAAPPSAQPPAALSAPPSIPDRSAVPPPTTTPNTAPAATHPLDSPNPTASVAGPGPIAPTTGPAASTGGSSGAAAGPALYFASDVTLLSLLTRGRITVYAHQGSKWLKVSLRGATSVDPPEQAMYRLRADTVPELLRRAIAPGTPDESLEWAVWLDQEIAAAVRQVTPDATDRDLVIDYGGTVEVRRRTAAPDAGQSTSSGPVARSVY